VDPFALLDDEPLAPEAGGELVDDEPPAVAEAELPLDAPSPPEVVPDVLPAEELPDCDPFPNPPAPVGSLPAVGSGFPTLPAHPSETAATDSASRQATKSPRERGDAIDTITKNSQ